MKKFNKFSSVCAALFCAATLTISGASLVMAESETDAAMEEMMISTAQSLTDTIVGLSDEEIEAYIGSGDPFTMQAMEAWQSSKSEVGAKVEDQSNAGEIEVSYEEGEYTVTVPVDFETADANFVYVLNETTGPVSLSVDVEIPMSLTLQRAGLNTLMGIGTVFIMLVFLSGVIYLFKFVPMLVEGKKKETPAPTPAPAPVAAPVVEEETDDEELIAVIAAAIAAAEGTSTDGFVVRSIRKVSRKKW